MNEQRERFQGHAVYSLSEIAMSLHRMIEQKYSAPYYIKAEILKLNYYPHSGHCYPELVERENNKIKAEMRAVIWASQYRQINDRFMKIAGESLKENIKILCLATLEYSPIHGLALHIQNIEPTYTLGEMVKNRQLVIERLKAEHVFDLNKKLPMPMLPKRVAVISVETSKGYSDFMKTLIMNRYGYRFHTELFPSVLQGDKAVTGITGCLERIKSRKTEFDCVVIVRGGGGDVGLSCYDDYTLAHGVATFCLPVLTGIGHSTNLTITDMVAHEYNITPTDVAFSLINKFCKFEEALTDTQKRIFERARLLIERHKLLLTRHIDSLRENITRLTQKQLDDLKNMEEKIHLLHPDNILKRGFSITRFCDKAVTNATQLKDGDEIKTKFFQGEITSVVRS